MPASVADSQASEGYEMRSMHLDTRWISVIRLRMLNTVRVCGRSLAMCECCKPKTCEKGKDPKTCTEERIKECDGDSSKHTCTEAADTAKK